MSPIIAFKLPILLSKPLDNQLLTLYLIRSNPNKAPYDPNYAKRAWKQSRALAVSPQPVKKSKSESSLKKLESKPSSKAKNETTKFKPEKSRKSKPLSESKNTAKSKSNQPVTSTPYSKKSQISPANESDKSTSQVLSIPSTSMAKSTQYGNTTKKTPPKKKHSDGQSSSSSRASVSGTPSTSRSDSSTPRTPLKPNQLNYPSPSPSKQKKSKPQPKTSVPEAYRNFKIPKKPKPPPVDEKLTIPKRLQPSGNSPIDLIIGPSPTVCSTAAKINESTQSRESHQLEEDFDSLEAAEPELGFDLYGAEGSFSQPLEDFCSVYNEPTTDKETAEEKEVDNPETSEWRQDAPMDQSLSQPPLPNQSILKRFDDDSESSDDEEGNFKRRGFKDRSKSETEKQEKRDHILPPKDSSTPTQSKPRSRPPSKSTSKVISLRPPPPPPSSSSSSSSRPPVPASLSPSLHLTSPQPIPPPQLSVSSSAPTVQTIISTITSIKSPEEAMKMFIKSVDCYPQILAVEITKFQNLFRNLLLNLFCDVNFILNKKKFEVLLKLIRQLSMDDSYNWEEIICSWGRNYQPLLSNQEKSENIVTMVTHIYNYLQSNDIVINLQTAGLLYEMKMAKIDRDN